MLAIDSIFWPLKSMLSSYGWRKQLWCEKILGCNVSTPQGLK